MAFEPLPQDLPPRFVAIAYVLALVCLITPLAILGVGFAGTVLFRRGRRLEGAGAIVVGAICVVVGFLLRT
jgi:hypothetical protein